MEVTKWYCDRCGKEFIAHYKLKIIEVSVALKTDDYMSRNGEFCNDCYNKVKEKLLSELLYREKNATCSDNAQVDKLRKAAEETEDNGVRKGILKAIEVLEGDKEDLSDYTTNYVEGLVLQEYANAPTWTFHLKDRTSEKIKNAYQTYKMIVGDAPHITLCHPLIKHTAERIGFENVKSNPYMPYDQTNQEGELLVIEERYGKVVFRVLDIPKEVLEED